VAPHRVRFTGSTSPDPPHRIRLTGSTSPDPPHQIHLTGSTSPDPPHRIHLTGSPDACWIPLAPGAAKTATYLFYLRAAGGLPFATGFLALLALYSSMNPLQSLALRNWMHTMEDSEGDERQGAMGACEAYTLAATGMIVVTGFRNIVLPYASVRASRKLHGAMMGSVMRAKVSWFEATPLGRILNRFSSDIAAIDQQVATQFKDVVVFSFNVSRLESNPDLGVWHVLRPWWLACA
jgi:hypothetical protein